MESSFSVRVADMMSPQEKQLSASALYYSSAADKTQVKSGRKFRPVHFQVKADPRRRGKMPSNRAAWLDIGEHPPSGLFHPAEEMECSGPGTAYEERRRQSGGGKDGQKAAHHLPASDAPLVKTVLCACFPDTDRRVGTGNILRRIPALFQTGVSDGLSPSRRPTPGWRRRPRRFQTHTPCGRRASRPRIRRGRRHSPA